MSTKETIIKETFGTFKRSRDEFLFFCPICKHHKRKLSINLEKNVYHCWVCDSKGKVLSLLKSYATFENVEKWKEITNELDISVDAIELLSGSYQEEKQVQRVKIPKEYKFLGTKNLTDEDMSALGYLYSRGIGDKEIKMYKIGYCSSGEYKNRVVFPSFDNEGHCNYFSSRSYTGDWLKYKNPNASKNIIFNELLIDWTQPVVLVEGVIDSIKIKNSIPLLGSTARENSILMQTIIENQCDVYIGLDQDADSKALSIIHTLNMYGIKTYRINTKEIEDIGSLTKIQAEKLKEEAVEANEENILLDLLSK